MNSYTFDEMQLGCNASFVASITEETMAHFLALSGDESPIHISAAYAAGRGYPGRVVYGMAVASLFSTLAGVYLPGENCLLHSVNSSFTKPVFIGDTLTIYGEVTDRQEIFKQVTIKAKITNQHGKTVCRGEIKAGVAI
ncbi:MaoC family dehydratase [Ruminococcaceae bacterium OttesenSCG-928-N02]|nr:MaoC family dehydratase [Ruminococcaceae bacterium OttesenSCG-928-N02]